MSELSVEEPTQPTLLPTIFTHCKTIYDAMMVQSAKVQDEDGEEHIVYEGFLTHLVMSELNFSNPYYTYCTRALKTMGCIRLVRRGGGRAPSQWKMIQAPTQKLFEVVNPPDSYKAGRERASVVAMLQSQIIALNNRLTVLEAIILREE